MKADERVWQIETQIKELEKIDKSRKPGRLDRF